LVNTHGKGPDPWNASRFTIIGKITDKPDIAMN